MSVEFTITFEDGHTRAVSFDRRRLKLKTLRRLQEVQRAMDDGQDWGELLPFIATLLGLTIDEAEEIELGDFEAIIAAMQRPGEPVPNESAPPSE